MHELRRKGQEIGQSNSERQDPKTSRRDARILAGRIEALYKETAVISEEWAAEVQYVHAARDMLADYVDGQVGADGDARVPVISGTERIEAMAKLEPKADFALLQSLSEGVVSWTGFRPTAALSDHREFLNEVLSANGIEPFLLRLSGRARDEAANLLGRTIVAMVPDGEIDGLRESELLLDYPTVHAALTGLIEGTLHDLTTSGDQSRLEVV